MKISIVICTYNRQALLKHCLESLCNQTALDTDYEILVIDNNSPDDTNLLVKEFMTKKNNLRYAKELKQGLSHARNRGYQVVKTDWVCYLDDDAKANPDYVERILWFIENHPYQFFGGVYLPWYHFGRPYWFKDKYASNKMKYTKVTELKNGEYVSGGVMVIKKQLLEKYGGFSPELGMVGDKIAYGEETGLQIQMRKGGVKIAYDPELIIYHVVAKIKLNVSFFMNAAFCLGRDQIEMNNAKTSFISLFFTSIVMIVMIFIHLLFFSPKLLSSTYYVENWIIDVFKKPAKRVGIIYTALLKKSAQNHKR